MININKKNISNEYTGILRLNDYSTSNKSYDGNIKLYTDKFNNKNYLEIVDTNKYDGKYLIN